MVQTGNLKSLAERMKEKAEQERIETEKVFTEQLQTLSSSLQVSSQNALHTMSDAMAQEITNAAETLNRHYRLLSVAFARKWIVSTVLGICLCIGMIAGGWSLVQILAMKVNEQRTELARLEKDQEIHREAVKVLETTYNLLLDQTSGIAVMEKDGSRYVTAPKGSESEHTINGRPALKLKE